VKPSAVAGFFILGVFAVADFFVRWRLKSVGYKWAFLRGGTLDYGEYRRYGKRYGWPIWPIYLVWVSLIVGLGLIIGSVIAHGSL
jgi:hypothetical protein